MTVYKPVTLDAPLIWSDISKLACTAAVFQNDQHHFIPWSGHVSVYSGNISPDKQDKPHGNAANNKLFRGIYCTLCYLKQVMDNSVYIRADIYDLKTLKHQPHFIAVTPNVGSFHKMAWLSLIINKDISCIVCFHARAVCFQPEMSLSASERISCKIFEVVGKSGIWLELFKSFQHCRASLGTTVGPACVVFFRCVAHCC